MPTPQGDEPYRGKGGLMDLFALVLLFGSLYVLFHLSTER